MTTATPAALFTGPASEQRLERTAAALTAHGFVVEILDDAAAARARIRDLIPEGASVFSGASETLRLSGIEEDINASGRYQPIRARVLAMDRATDLSTALRRVEDHCLPLEDARARAAYGYPSAINRLLILNAEYILGRGTVLLLRQAIGF
jgi:hypothetical protein